MKTKQQTTTSLGEFLSKERSRAGLSMSRLSKLSGVGQATISETENGVHTPRLSTLVRMLQAIETSQ